MAILASGIATASSVDGVVVTLSSGTFPATVVAGTIFEARSGTYQYEAVRVLSRDSTTQITLTSSIGAAFASIDWQITDFVTVLLQPKRTRNGGLF